MPAMSLGARLLSYELALSFAAWIAAHITVAVQLARQGAWRRATIALCVPPLAPWWAWHSGCNKTALAWAASLTLYAIGVALS